MNYFSDIEDGGNNRVLDSSRLSNENSRISDLSENSSCVEAEDSGVPNNVTDKPANITSADSANLCADSSCAEANVSGKLAIANTDSSYKADPRAEFIHVEADVTDKPANTNTDSDFEADPSAHSSHKDDVCDKLINTSTCSVDPSRVETVVPDKHAKVANASVDSGFDNSDLSASVQPEPVGKSIDPG